MYHRIFITSFKIEQNKFDLQKEEKPVPVLPESFFLQRVEGNSVTPDSPDPT